jgi:HAD superfamily hydrolase (TIGR01459 family)
MQDLSIRYPVWFCDVWGVVHDGIRCFPAAVDALRRHRERGGLVLLITNAPRPHANVEAQLQRLGGAGTYDRVVTSGDVTRSLLEQHRGGTVHHIGPERDLGIFEGTGVARADVAEAEAVLCTGLLDDEAETPEDYRPSFEPMIARGLALICANPDLVVRRGDRLVHCAGALAKLYADMGGETLLAGKPYPPIYDLALAEAARLAGRSIAKAEVLAIGDGPDTDIRGAAENGFDALLIGGGIHEPGVSLEKLERDIRARIPSARIVRTLEELAWS